MLKGHFYGWIKMQSIQSLIETKLFQALEPTHLSVVNESHLHSVPKGSQTHFKIEIVSHQFENKKLLERHRMINKILADEISQIRACSLYAFTPAEWTERKNEVLQSPTCSGGSKR